MNLLYKGIYWMFMIAVLGLGALLIASLVPVAHIQVKVVKSGSMEPAIKTGGIVIDRPAASYSVGDIITFGADTRTQIPTTHRIVAVSGEGSGQMFTTKGDANDAPDPGSTRLSDIRGKVIFTAPYIGYVLDFARKPLGFALLVGVPAAFIILEEVGKIVRELLRLRRRKTITHATEQASYISRPKVD
jgi:signal peptidase